MPEQLVNLTIDGAAVSVPAGTLLIEAAKQAGVLVPHYCYHPGLPVAGVCRMCLVEIEKAPKLQIACATTVTEGMVVKTQGPAAKSARQSVLEFLLINHPLDCPICDQAGECELQDFVFQEGQPGTRYGEFAKRFNPVEDFGPDVLYVPNRCILCTRCVRFMEDVAQEPVLNVSERGDRAFIGIHSDGRLDHPWAGNVVDLCPVGSLLSKDFLHKARAWELDKAASSCTRPTGTRPSTSWRAGCAGRAARRSPSSPPRPRRRRCTSRASCSAGSSGAAPSRSSWVRKPRSRVSRTSPSAPSGRRTVGAPSCSGTAGTMPRRSRQPRPRPWCWCWTSRTSPSARRGSSCTSGRCSPSAPGTRRWCCRSRTWRRRKARSSTGTGGCNATSRRSPRRAWRGPRGGCLPSWSRRWSGAGMSRPPPTRSTGWRRRWRRFATSPTGSWASRERRRPPSPCRHDLLSHQLDRQDPRGFHGHHGRRGAAHAGGAPHLRVDAGPARPEPGRPAGFAATGGGRAEEPGQRGNAPCPSRQGSVYARAGDVLYPGALDLRRDPVRHTAPHALG